MAAPDLEERILETIKTYNDRNEPIGKKAIYNMKFAAITTVQKAIKSLEADGKITEHMVTLPRGTYCMLMVRPEGQPKDETIRQHIADMTLYQVRKNGETLDKILKTLEESRNAQDNL